MRGVRLLLAFPHRGYPVSSGASTRFDPVRRLTVAIAPLDALGRVDREERELAVMGGACVCKRWPTRPHRS